MVTLCIACTRNTSKCCPIAGETPSGLFTLQQKNGNKDNIKHNELLAVIMILSNSSNIIINLS